MGALEIKEDKLVENSEKMGEFRKLEEARLIEEVKRQEEDEKFKELMKKDDLDEIEDDVEQEYGGEELTEAQFEKMMEKWK